MKKTLMLGAVLAVTSLAGCSIMPETISRDPEKGTVSTAGVGEAIYTYDKKGKVFVDYMNGKSTNQTDSVKQEIIYSGLSKGELKITYREYMNDYARASFFQDATYDYSPQASTMISFKGAQVEILDANNTQVKYKVLKGFSDEQLKPME
ncbi:hypothetical protein [Marinobacter sp. ELB17]|uniref:hypothetical protein n=1 Tax=Marinobacter sp. ELB17 TaxID=270374 RepID=UPI0000F37EE8|nr:hypothetical protein [Marinobacter sp. ELB17]EBA00430.1 hypothetical protein MELB17_04902 [Marinobacter sp. ELB17]